MLRVLVTCLTLAFLTQAGAQPVQERRVALVIGVTDYDAVANLTNPRIGARQVYEALRATGFEVDGPLDSPTKAELDAALQAFSRRADNADVALLYFAGHGMQQFDDNWLIPSSATLARPSDIVLEGVPLQNVVRLMAGARLRLIFLDACRNNPFSARWPSTMSPTDGLAELSEDAVPAGTVLAYSAGPRQLAPDNGVFAQALATHIQHEGVELRQVLDRVRRDVTRVTPSLNPTHTIALNTAPFYFRGAPVAPSQAPTLLTYASPEQAPDARQTASDVRAPLVRSEDVSRLRDFALFRECDACPEMVVLPAGTFLMGSPQDEAGRLHEEDDQAGPGGEQVQVSLRRFAIGRFELMAEEWFACVDADGGCSQQVLGRRRLPVAGGVRWNDLPAYFTWLNTRAGGGAMLVSASGGGAYRLPSEAEWEYAARAGTRTAYSFGDDAASLGDHAWYAENAEGGLHEIGGKAANPFGLYDVHGNLLEWVQDCCAPSYADHHTNNSAHETDGCTNRVVRGGSWTSSLEYLRSAGRYGFGPADRYGNVGFRVARTL